MTPRPEPSQPLPHVPDLPARMTVAPVSQYVLPSASKAATASTSENGLTPAFLWRVYCQWWKWVVPLGLALSVLAGFVVWYSHVPLYEATLQIKIETAVPYIAFEKGSGSISGDSDLYIQTQLEMIRSSVVLDKVLGRPEIASIREVTMEVEPVKHLQERLSINRVGKSEFYRVSYVSRSPQHAKIITDTIVAEYMSMQDRFDSERVGIVIATLKETAEDRENELQQLRTEVVELAKEVTGRDPFGQGVVMDVAAFSPAASIYANLIEADVSIAVLKAELEALSDAPLVVSDRLMSSGQLELEVTNHPEVRRLDQYLISINDEMIRIKDKRRARIGDRWERDPDYLRLQELAVQTRTNLEELKTLARKQITEFRAQQRKEEQQRLITDKQREMNVLSQRQALLAKQFQDYLQERKAGGAQSAALALKMGELERKEKVYELIAARRLALETEREAPARVSLFERSAKAPSIAIESVPYKLLFVACSLAFLAPLALAVGHETMVRRIASPEQLTKESLLPVLGEVTRFPKRQVSTTQQNLPAARKRELFIFAESIDGLRTNLMLTENLGMPGQRKVLAVCSATSGEGKTSIATALAMSIAQATKQPTLVLDADLRAPDIAAFLEVPSHPGAAEVLSGTASLRQAIHRVGITHAYVMPAGKLQVNPHHILQGARVNNLLAILREKFATIVIDTPPVLSASESLVYARAADLVVFCSLADVSRAKQVRVAVDRLQSTGANIAGAVLSGIEVSRYVSNYGSYAHNS